LKKENYFLAVSSLNYRKNIIAVLQSFILFSAENKSIKLYLIGDLEAKSFAKINIENYLKNPQIKILGRVSDRELIKYYSHAKGFIYPSLYEGFGLPPLEAQNCDCPVLVSKISSLPEVFSDSALYCNPFSTESIALNMLSLTDENICESLKKKSRQNIKRFSWEQSAVSILKIIGKYQ
jgi:glycosyltransferase involved in cell wall biosynthesis